SGMRSSPCTSARWSATAWRAGMRSCPMPAVSIASRRGGRESARSRRMPGSRSNACCSPWPSRARCACWHT
ncbi:MAG: DNA polymerase III delta subunit, partial [uncultured Lysobacter sp.]